MIELDATQQAQAVDQALTNWWGRRAGRARVEKIAAIVFAELPKIVGEGRNLDDPLTPEDRAAAIEHCRKAIEQSPDRQAIIGAFPVWLFAMIAKIIIGYLIDWWFTKQHIVVTQTP